MVKPNPPQKQQPPGLEKKMYPYPESEEKEYRGCNKLQGKTALITGGDSGIGKAVAIAFAKEGADVSIVYNASDEDAERTRQLIEKENKRCFLQKGDVGDSQFCEEVVNKIAKEFGSLNILVNNAGEQHPQEALEKITNQQLEKTFRTNIFSMFFLTRSALPLLQEGDTIINTASVTAYKGNPFLLDYSSTKGAIVSFTRSLSLSLLKRGIRVNAVAPGPIWTPLISSTFSKEKVKTFGQNVPMGREGQPNEVATSFVFLASTESSYMSGQVLHPNGGESVES